MKDYVIFLIIIQLPQGTSINFFGFGSQHILKEYTEEFTEEMVIPYRTEELNTYLRYPNQEINNNHLHSEHIRLQIRDILQIPLIDKP